MTATDGMKLFTRAELADIRSRLARNPGLLGGDAALAERLLCHAEYGLDCAKLLDEAVHYPAEPYGEAEVLVARLTDGLNDIWNRHHYRERTSIDAS